MGDLIWAGAFFVPLMVLIVWLTPALRRAIEAVTAAHTVSAAERDAGVQAVLADVAERRHKLAISQALLSEETAAGRARLLAETAEHDIDREAAGKTLDAAVQGRERVIAARADAAAELAPEIARAVLKDGGEDMAALSAAYAAYCKACPGTPGNFTYWVGSFRGLGG